MEISNVIFLAVVQGLTEFFPISSSGHLVAARLLFNISDNNGIIFDAFLHLGTLTAILIFYWRVWWGITLSMVNNDQESKDKRELFGKIAIATIPAAFVGYFFEEMFSGMVRSAQPLALSFLATGAFLWLADQIASRVTSLNRATTKDAVLIGLAQVFALIPGISRSGITIAAGRARGLSRQQAVNFSFLIAAPIIAGAGLSSLPKLFTPETFPANQLFLAYIISLVTGLIAISILFKIIERLSFTPFVIYLIGLAVVILYVG
jgi:undecaprenyl-diphosphatase